MANTTNNNSARKTHVAPGIYTQEIDLTYASKSLGLTTLGVVGETLKGPAFQPTMVESWREYQSLFGDTSTELFRGSQYPKYELPYIAKEYLKESTQLQVCRVLGLSGVNAGAAWIISAYNSNAEEDDETAYTEEKPVVIAVLRSRGEHKKAAFVDKANLDKGICDDVYEYDKLVYYATEVKMDKSDSLSLNDDCTPGYSKSKTDLVINSNNYGTFTLVVTTYEGEEKRYAVTLNPGDKNYILNVLGTDPEVGDCEIFVEELYDVALSQLVERGEIDTLMSLDTQITLKKATDGGTDDCGNVYSEGAWIDDATGCVSKIVTAAEETGTDSCGNTYEKGDWIYSGTGCKVGNADATTITFETDGIPTKLKTFEVVNIIPAHSAVTAILTEDESTLTKSMVGQRYLYSNAESVNSEKATEKLKVHISTNNGKSWTSVNGIAGHIYTVVSHLTSDGTREYYYGEYLTGTVKIDDGNYTIDPTTNVINEKNYKTEYLSEKSTVGEDGYQGAPASTLSAGTDISTVFQDAVEVLSDGYYYRAVKTGEETTTDEDGQTQTTDVVDVEPITLDLNNYKEEYRCASTPWIVSELKGSASDVELTKLFRFHTISDGNDANTEIKISIENIDPDEGTFDVVVRSFSDTDGSISRLERFSQCDLTPGSSGYISYKIGSTDGAYAGKSNYITVEVNENDKTRLSIPAGFLGYPVRCYDVGLSADVTTISLAKPYLEYNTNVDDDIRVNKQYFGMSDLVGIDEDVLKYKGVEAYNDLPSGLSPCFHLDSRIFEGIPNSDGVVTEDGLTQTVTVDGIKGYQWATVGKGNTTEAGIEPRIGTEGDMVDTIYEDKRYRKFTVCFYGGWDGWDYYRTSRSNSDDFRYGKYRGKLNYNSGEGDSFSVIRNADAYNFDSDTKAITSDYYAYLSGIYAFDNPNDIDINVFATPGIDYVNQNALVTEAVTMIEEDRADSVYVITTPDKPFGAGETVSEMYTPSEAVDNLEASNLTTNYGCSFYPWLQVQDTNNSQYIYLPVTKDVVRNFAATDNKQYPWYASAGWNRGIVNGTQSRRTLKKADEDELYAGRLNYIKKFATEGYRIWGDKNLQDRESDMDRISARRLLIHLRKTIAIASVSMIFDPISSEMVRTFESAITPILDDIVAKRGLYDYRIEIDDSQEAFDRRELNCKLFLKVMKMLEWIQIDFVITPSSVDFENV